MKPMAGQWEIPIHACIVMEKNGTPYFARKYSRAFKNWDSSKTVLLAGFLSAIDTFSKTNLEGKLRDIGFGDERFFFESATDDLVIVISTPDPFAQFASPIKSVENELVIAKIMERTRLAIELIEATASKESIPLVDMFANFSQILDSIILESLFVDAEMELVDDYFNTTKEIFNETSDFSDIDFDSIFKKLNRFFGNAEFKF